MKLRAGIETYWSVMFGRRRTALADGVAALSLGVPFWVWTRRLPDTTDSAADLVGLFASAAGLVAAWCLLLVLILASRFPGQRLVYDEVHLRHRHRCLGVAALILTCVHVALNAVRAILRHDGLLGSVAAQLHTSPYLLAMLGLVGLGLTGVTARRLSRSHSPWELFFRSHRVAAVVGVVLSLWHEVDAMVTRPTALLATWICGHVIAVIAYVFGRVCSGRIVSRQYQLRLSEAPRPVHLSGDGCWTWVLTVRGKHLERLGPPGLEAALGYTGLQIQRSDRSWSDSHPLSIRRVLISGECFLRLRIRTAQNDYGGMMNAEAEDRIRISGFHGQMTASSVARPNGRVAILANGFAVETALIPLAQDLSAQNQNVTILIRLKSWTGLTPSLRESLARLSAPRSRVLLSVGERAVSPCWLGTSSPPDSLTDEELESFTLIRPGAGAEGRSTVMRLFPSVEDWEFFVAGSTWVGEVARDLRRAGVSRQAMHLEMHSGVVVRQVGRS